MLFFNGIPPENMDMLCLSTKIYSFTSRLIVTLAESHDPQNVVENGLKVCYCFRSVEFQGVF